MQDVPIEQITSHFDGPGSEEYRRQDEIAIALGGSYAHYSSILRHLTASPRQSLHVLEVGCGTGRYFHCLENIERLVGIDVAPEMIRRAADPVRKSEITAKSIELVCSDSGQYEPGDAKFDLIYSIGVLGEYSPLDTTVVRRLASMLNPGGTLFLTAVDAASRVSPPVIGKPSLPRRIVAKAFPWLPHTIRVVMNRRLSPFYVTRADIGRAFESSGLTVSQVSRYVHQSGWRGVHWDVLAAPTSGRG